MTFVILEQKPKPKRKHPSLRPLPIPGPSLYNRHPEQTEELVQSVAYHSNCVYGAGGHVIAEWPVRPPHPVGSYANSSLKG